MPTNNNNNTRPFQNLWRIGTDPITPEEVNSLTDPEGELPEDLTFNGDPPGEGNNAVSNEPFEALSSSRPSLNIWEQQVERAARSLSERLASRRISIISGGLSSTDTPFGEEATFKQPEIDPEKLVSLQNGDIAKYKDVVMIDYQYYLKTDNNIVPDYFRPEEYTHKNNSTRLNVEFDNEGLVKNKSYAYYDPRRIRANSIITIEDSRDQYLTDYNILPKDSYVECIKTNIFYHKTVSYKAVLNKQLKIKARKANCIYKPSYNKTNLAKDYAMGVLSPSFVKTEGKRYTFGLEMETISGIIPQYMDSDLNYLSIRDGSLRDENGEEYGHEYVTGVLVGDTGMLQSKKLCNALTSRCMVNRKCGLHMHTGGIKFNNELIVYLYKLSLLVEKEIFSMMPVSRRENEYCKKLKPFKFNFSEEDLNNPNRYNALIEEYYTQIYKFIATSEHLPSAKFNKKSQHPMGAKCGYNHSTARYCWMNFVPTIFDTRGNGQYTIENRIHQGTTNFTKVKNWILINMGLIWYAENYGKEIALATGSISLKYIMKLAYPKSHKEINDYIDLRSTKFNCEDSEKNKQNELNDYSEVVESNDLTFKNL